MGKLPDRSVHTNALPFSASSFSRHRGLGPTTTTGDFEGPKQPAQQSAPPGSHAPAHAQDANPLNRLTEDQREEINEAVSSPGPKGKRSMVQGKKGKLMGTN